jgi:hypothetical protein
VQLIDFCKWSDLISGSKKIKKIKLDDFSEKVMMMMMMMMKGTN